MTPEARPTGLLLGAGASRFLGYPTLGDLTQQVERILPSDLASLYWNLLKGDVPVGSGLSPSVETVLAIVDAALQHRLPPAGLGLRDLSFLGHEARKAIWSILSEERGSREVLARLDPLAELARGDSPLVVFSLNNDRVIERWCHASSVPLIDGFDRRGVLDPSLLEPERGKVTLVKLHGSVDWESTPAGQARRLGRLVRSPAGRRAVRSPLPELTLVFPSESKVVTEQPLFDLFRRFHDLLPRLSTLVVAGCGLHDPHVVSAIRHALLRSRELRILIVDPVPDGALGALTGKRLRSVVGDRIDALPMPFEAALSGALQERLARRSSPGALLRWVLLEASRPEAGRALASLARALGNRSALPGRDGTALTELVRAPSGVDRVLGPWSRVSTLLFETAPPGPAIPELLEALDQAIVSPLPRAIDESPEGVFALTGDRLWRCESAVRPREAVGPRLPGAVDLAMVGRTAYVLEERLFRHEGVGCLRRIDARTGRSARLTRDGRRLAIALLPRLPGILPLLYRRGETSRQLLKRRLDAAGLLSWPSAVLNFPGGRLLLIESRRPALIDPAAHEVAFPLPSVFINLLDAALVSPTQVVLLEAGVAGHGRLWLWSVPDGKTSTLLDNVSWGAGLAWDANRHLLLVTQGGELPHGQVVGVPLDPTGSAGEPRVLADGLHRPRRLFRKGDGAWLCCTGHGLVQLKL